MRFVHGALADEAAGIVAHAPRQREPEASERVNRLDELQREVISLSDKLKVYESRSGMRHRLLELVRELADLEQQRSDKAWEVWCSGSAESVQIVLALDHVESDLRSEIAQVTAKLVELDSSNQLRLLRVPDIR
jgi:hypothetical protein